METSTATLSIDQRLNGPPNSANGGFASGLIAETVGGTASVRLIRPIPLGGTPMDVTVVAGHAEVTDAEHQVMATAERIAPFTMLPPIRPSLDDAHLARTMSPLHRTAHLLSNCVVCGNTRDDGLNVTPGPLPGRSDILAAPFEPQERDSTDGVVHPAAVWGALDCPSYPATALLDGRIGLLGTLAVHRNREVLLGERLVVVGWTVERHGRSSQTASALLDDSGDVVASARAIWIELRHQWLVRLAGRLPHRSHADRRRP